MYRLVQSKVYMLGTNKKSGGVASSFIFREYIFKRPLEMKELGKKKFKIRKHLPDMSNER